MKHKLPTELFNELKQLEEEFSKEQIITKSAQVHEGSVDPGKNPAIYSEYAPGELAALLYEGYEEELHPHKRIYDEMLSIVSRMAEYSDIGDIYETYEDLRNELSGIVWVLDVLGIFQEVLDSGDGESQGLILQVLEEVR